MPTFCVLDRSIFFCALHISGYHLRERERREEDEVRLESRDGCNLQFMSNVTCIPHLPLAGEELGGGLLPHSPHVNLLADNVCWRLMFFTRQLRPHLQIM